MPCVVNLSIKPRGVVDPKAAMANFPMEVVPAQLTIPPQESRYTSILFNPRAIAPYSAMLEAVVENGSDPSTNNLTCELRGEGTLPTLTLLEPSTFDTSGRPCCSFGRVLLGRASVQAITLRNNGQLPATARLEAPPHAAFSVIEGPMGVQTVEPGRALGFKVEFRPQAAGGAEHTMWLRVQVRCRVGLWHMSKQMKGCCTVLG